MDYCKGIPVLVDREVVVLLLLSLLPPGGRGRSVNIDSSVGQYLSLSCPSPAPPASCGSSCSWSGPHNLTVSSQHSQQGLHVTFNQSQCECLLFIQNTSLDHSGLWSCQLSRDTRDTSNQHRDSNTTALNHSGSLLDGVYVDDTKEIRVNFFSK